MTASDSSRPTVTISSSMVALLALYWNADGPATRDRQMLDSAGNEALNFKQKKNDPAGNSSTDQLANLFTNKKAKRKLFQRTPFKWTNLVRPFFSPSAARLKETSLSNLPLVVECVAHCVINNVVDKGPSTREKNQQKEAAANYTGSLLAMSSLATIVQAKGLSNHSRKLLIKKTRLKECRYGFF